MTNKPSIAWSGDPNTIPVQYLTICDVLAVGPTASSDSTNSVNSVTMTLGNAQTGEIYTTSAILFNAPGIYSVPLPPGTISNNKFTPSSVSLTGSQVIAFPRNDQWIVLAVRDTRTQLNPGNIQPGEAAMQATGSAGRNIIKNDGSINLYTLNGNNSMGLFITPSNNAVNCINSNGYGLNITNTDLTLSASTSSPQGGSLNIEDSGAVNLVATKQIQMDGSSIVLGSNVLPGDNTVVINPAEIQGTLVNVVVVLLSLQTAVAMFTGTGTFPGIAAVGTQIGALVDQVAALTDLITSKKVVAE
jgi:hypothetical protein